LEERYGLYESGKQAHPNNKQGDNMRKVIETVEAEGLEKYLGEKILLLCANYFSVQHVDNIISQENVY